LKLCLILAALNCHGKSPFDRRIAFLLPAREALASHNLHRALRQRTEEGAAVILREHARVEDYDDAFVLLGPDEATDALAEFEDGQLADGL